MHLENRADITNSNWELSTGSQWQKSTQSHKQVGAEEPVKGIATSVDRLDTILASLLSCVISIFGKTSYFRIPTMKVRITAIFSVML